MPLNTNTSSTTPPEVVVDVNNGGGGTGPTAVLHVCVVWDPAYLDLLAVQNPTGGNYHVSAADGYCIWYGHSIPWASSLGFKLSLCRKRTGATWVIASAMNVRTGDQSAPTVWLVPPGHVSCRIRPPGGRGTMSKRKGGGRKKA